MTVTITAVPESVTLEQACDLIQSLGIDPGHLTRDGITIGYHAITCKVYATDADGHRYLDETGDRIAVHEIRIPVNEATEDKS